MESRYSRENPSPRYRELLAYYQQLHEEGDGTIPSEEMYMGTSTLYFASAIRNLIRYYGARTLLDYGAGKGRHYTAAKLVLPDGRKLPPLKEYWQFESVTCYDPGYAPFREVPTGTFDGVICCDVLEHCPQEDLPWIIDELFRYAKKFVFANVASYPALKHLPNGENAHCSVLAPSWWEELIRETADRYPTVGYHFQIAYQVRKPNGEMTYSAHFVQSDRRGDGYRLQAAGLKESPPPARAS